MTLDDLEKLDKARTPGRWSVKDAFPVLEIMHPSKVGISAVGIKVASGNNAEFIAACSEMVPRMIKRLRLAERIINSVDGHPYLKEDVVMAMFVREYREAEPEKP